MTEPGETHRVSLHSFRQVCYGIQNIWTGQRLGTNTVPWKKREWKASCLENSYGVLSALSVRVRLLPYAGESHGDHRDSKPLRVGSIPATRAVQHLSLVSNGVHVQGTVERELSTWRTPTFRTRRVR